MYFLLAGGLILATLGMASIIVNRAAGTTGLGVVVFLIGIVLIGIASHMKAQQNGMPR